MIAETRSYIFRWRSHCRRRRIFVNSLVWPRKLCSWRKTSLVKRSSLSMIEGTRHICGKVLPVGRPVLTNGKRPLFPYSRIEIEHWWSRRFCGNSVGKLRHDRNRHSTFHILIWVTDALFSSYKDVSHDREDHIESRLLQCHHFFQSQILHVTGELSFGKIGISVRMTLPVMSTT